MRGRQAEVTKVWPDDPVVRDHLERPRHDLLIEARADGGTASDLEFRQIQGPFTEYSRVVSNGDGAITERTTYRLAIPWFGWLFTLPVRSFLARRSHPPTHDAPPRTPWWAPPDQIDPRQSLVLGLLAVASMSSAFINTLFTQTANFAADDFAVSDSAVSVGASVVRAGIVVAMPLALLADRVGRRRIITFAAWAAPIVTALGAFAPSFPTLVATQAIGRPLGLTLDFLIAVAVAEEMPRNSRAYAVSVMAMASGLGAGIAVAALPLADLGTSGWRAVYLVSFVWLIVAVDISRRLPETHRFERVHAERPPFHLNRFLTLAIVAVCANFFIAPASFFQNKYLRDVRELSATEIALFTLSTGTPAAIGLIVGGRLADVRGRRHLIAVAIPVATLLVIASFALEGVPMWLSAFGGGFVGGIAYPALAVYRAELFPTGNRGLAAGLLTAAALVGGIGGLLLVGQLRDRGWSYASVIGLVGLGQIIVVATVLTRFPETAHRELEDLNPEDRTPTDPASA